MFRALKGLLLVCTISGQQKISSSLSTVNATFGSQVTIDCNAAANETIAGVIWERSTTNGNITFNPDIIGISGSTPEDPSLTILVASTIDSGLYTCYIKTNNKTIQGNTTILRIEGASPTINVEFMSLSGIYGIPITLYVNIDATPPAYHIYWTKANDYGDLITINARATGFEGGNISVPSLTISYPIFTDKGLYTCYARNAVGVGHSHTIYIDIKGDVPVVSLDALEFKVPFGSQVSLDCTVTSNPNHTRIYWQKHSNDIITTITQDTEGITGCSIASPMLTIEFVTITDTGSYTCFAENSVGVGSSRSTLLNVTGGRPFVTIGTTIYSTEYGTPVTLICEATGDPRIAFVYWHKKSYGGIWSTITSGSYGIEGVNVTQPSLTLLFPVKSDAGEYICVAVNDLGSGRSLPSLLTVIGEHPLVRVHSIGSSAKHGDSYTFYCTVKATPVHHDVYWELTKNDVVRKITSETAGIRGVNEDNPSLTINVVTISDDGLYTCVARNIVGTGKSQTLRLSVDAAVPFVTAELSSYSVKEGTVVTLLCRVSSKPEHTHVYWQRETVGAVAILKKGTTGIIGATIDNPSLTFTNVGGGDSGHYICFATNIIGTGSSRTVILEVEPLIEMTTVKTLIVISQPTDYTSNWAGTIAGIFSSLFIMGGTCIACLEYKRNGKDCICCHKDSKEEAVPSKFKTEPSNQRKIYKNTPMEMVGASKETVSQGKKRELHPPNLPNKKETKKSKKSKSKIIRAYVEDELNYEKFVNDAIGDHDNYDDLHGRTNPLGSAAIEIEQFDFNPRRSNVYDNLKKGKESDPFANTGADQQDTNPYSYSGVTRDRNNPSSKYSMMSLF